LANASISDVQMHSLWLAPSSDVNEKTDVYDLFRKHFVAHTTKALYLQVGRMNWNATQLIAVSPHIARSITPLR